MNAIWVIIENIDSRKAQEALNAGKQLVDLLGASLLAFQLDDYTAASSTLSERDRPRLILAPDSLTSRDCLANLAGAYDGDLVVNAQTIQVDDDQIQATYPAYGGRLTATLTLAPDRTTCITLQSGAFPPIIDPDAIPVQHIHSQDKPGITIESQTVIQPQTPLIEASIIVSGGRGLMNNPAQPPANTDSPGQWRGREGFASLIRPLAKRLGAQIASSRGAVDAGTIDHPTYVGQTGKHVRPDLYLAVGISGAIQHRYGMENSRVIVAINRDPDAPIFSFAHYGVVDDLYTFLPALIDALDYDDLG